MGDIERERTAVHEAAHHVMAALSGWRLGPVSIEAETPGHGAALNAPPLVEVPADVDYDEPFVRWPAEVRKRLEDEVLVLLAGDAAEMLFAVRTGRGPEPVAVTAAAMAAGIAGTDGPPLPAPSWEERALITAACDDPAVLSDGEVIARLAGWAHWGDVAAAGAWIAYLETQARALLLARERQVRRLAEALLASGTVGAQAAARLLEASS